MNFLPRHGLLLEFYSQKGAKKNLSLLTIGQLVLNRIMQRPIATEAI